VADDYRSYVVRVRRSGRASRAVRLEVEDLLGGRRAAVTGSPAEVIGDRLEEIVRPQGTDTREGTEPPEEGGRSGIVPRSDPTSGNPAG
jgi:hypothetical protein